MKIQNIFERDLARNINGVIKADQIDDTNRWVELDEYVVTHEIKKCLEQFFSGYNSDLKSQSCGVWIRGFFGSGKSHLIKILSYLLENRPVTRNGISKTPLEFFQEKIDDKLFMGEITQAVTQIDTEVILFNIDMVADSFKDAMLSAFQSVFDAKLGYCKKYPYIAEIERILESDGKLTAFVDNLKQKGKDWYTVRDQGIAFFMDDIASAMGEVLGKTADDAKFMIEKTRQDYTLSVDTFIAGVEKYLKVHPKKRIVFFVDEISQFIGNDNSKMLTLQSIAEGFATRCNGRAWLVVTAQAAIDSVFADGKGQQFSKIFDRFRIKITLSSSNVDEVIRQRLLKKVPSAEQELANVYKAKGDIINNQTIFSGIAQTYNHIESEGDFIACYPFLPYQFTLVQKIFEGISKHGIGGLYLSNGARSLLDSFQRALQAVQEEQCDTALVPLRMFYTSIREFLNTKIISTINRADENPALDDFDRNLLKTLLLIRVVEDMPGTIDNLNILCIDKVDADKIEQKTRIDRSLVRLEAQNLINHNGDKFYFLTDEEQNVAREINRQNVSNAEISKYIGDTIYDIYGTNNRYKYKPNGKMFTFDLKHDEQLIKCTGTEDLHVIVVPEAAGYVPSKCILTSASCDCGLLICYADDTKVTSEITKFLQIRKYLTANNSNTLPSDRKQIYSVYQSENAERQAIVLNMLKDKLSNATYYVAGNVKEISGVTPMEMLYNALEQVVNANFHKLKLLEKLSSDPDAEMKALLRDDSALGFGVDAANINVGAAKEVENWLLSCAQRNMQCILKETIDRFGICPCGWPEKEVQLILVRMYAMGKINFIAQGNVLNPDQIFSYFMGGPRKWNEVSITQKVQIGDTVLQSARVLFRDIFKQTAPSDQNEFDAQVKGTIAGILRKMDEYSGIIRSHKKWPGQDIIDKYRPELAALLQNKDSAVFIQKFLESADLLNNFADDYEKLDGFYTSNIRNWSKLESDVEQYKENKSYFDAATIAQIDTLAAMLTDSDPYSKVAMAKKLSDQIADKQLALVKKYRELADGQVTAIIEQVKQDLSANNVDSDKDLSNECLRPLQELRKQAADENSILKLDNAYKKRASDLREEALDTIKQQLAAQQQQMIAKRSKTVFVQNYMKPDAPYLKTKDDVKNFIQALEKAMNEIIDEENYVVIK